MYLIRTIVHCYNYNASTRILIKSSILFEVASNCDNSHHHDDAICHRVIHGQHD